MTINCCACCHNQLRLHMGSLLPEVVKEFPNELNFTHIIHSLPIGVSESTTSTRCFRAVLVDVLNGLSWAVFDCGSFNYFKEAVNITVCTSVASMLVPIFYIISYSYISDVGWRYNFNIIIFIIIILVKLNIITNIIRDNNSSKYFNHMSAMHMKIEFCHGVNQFLYHKYNLSYYLRNYLMYTNMS